MNTDQTISIRRELPTTETASQLIHELDTYLSPMYPEESQHGYSIEKLVEQKVEFFVLYHDERPAGCAGIQFFPDPAEPSGTYGELKRMYVRDQFRGLGLGKTLLRHIERVAIERGVVSLRLETGIHQPEAIGLYESNGFRRVPPFGEYREDPLSYFYEKCPGLAVPLPLRARAHGRGGAHDDPRGGHLPRTPRAASGMKISKTMAAT